MSKKSILFVINTLGKAGAEMALKELLWTMDGQELDISLFVLTGQGEMITELPPYVKRLNPTYHACSVLSKEGKIRLARTVLSALWKKGAGIKNAGYVVRNLLHMIRVGRIQADKLLWKILSDSAPIPEETFDLAVAYLEGGATYYVADHAKARQKAAFIHVAYEHAGYTPLLDGDAYEHIQHVFAVSEEIGQRFLEVHPEKKGCVEVFPNLINQERILKKADKPGGFPDGDFKGIRLLSVGRLTYQKGFEIAVEAMDYLKKRGVKDLHWYILGEGELRKPLEKLVEEKGLQNEFFLLGAVDNPYPYYKACDIYVHATRFEGKSIAIQEAMTLGCPVIASDNPGNRQQLTDGKEGLLCKLTPEDIGDKILYLIRRPDVRLEMGQTARTIRYHQNGEIEKLIGLTREETGYET